MQWGLSVAMAVPLAEAVAVAVVMCGSCKCWETLPRSYL